MTFGVNKPWILSNLAGETGGSDLLEAAGYNLTSGKSDRQVRAHQLSRAPTSAGRRSPASRAKGTCSSSTTSRWSPAITSSRSARMVTRQKMFMDVEAAHKGRWTFTQDSRLRHQQSVDAIRPRFSGNIGTGVGHPVGLEPSFYVQDTWQVDQQPDVQPRVARYDLDNSTTTVNRYVDDYNARIVARLGGAPPLQKSVADKNNFSPRLGVVWVPTADRQMTLSASFGLYYDQNHWNFTDIYLNETLLALRRVNLNANTQANNPFWTPANTAVGIAQMRAFLARNYPGLSGPQWPAVPGGDHSGRGPRLQDSRTRANSSVGITREFGSRLSLRADYVHTRTHDPSIGPDTNWIQNADGTFARRDLRYGNITLVKNGGFIEYDGLLTRAELRASATCPRRTVLHVVQNDVEHVHRPEHRRGHEPVQSGRGPGPRRQRSPSQFRVRRVLLIPKVDVQAAGIASYRSAVPYSVSTSFQLDTDPFSDRPEPRNSKRGDKEKNVRSPRQQDFRFGGHYTATAFWEMFNVFNVDNCAALPGQPAVVNLRAAADRGPEATPAARVPFRFLTGEGDHPMARAWLLCSDVRDHGGVERGRRKPQAAPGPQKVVAVRAGRLVDPESGTVATNQIIVIEGERIRQVGAESPIPAGAEVIELSEFTVLPGLVDAHTHMAMTYKEVPENNCTT